MLDKHRLWLIAAIAALLSGLVLGATSSANHPSAFAKPLVIPPVITDANVTLTAREADVQIFDGQPTRMWTYNGMFPGPTIRRPAGQTTQVTLTNNLPAAGDLTLHNHGNHSTPENDGQPDNYLIAPGGSRTYTYNGLENGKNERGATQWYHDHRMDVTARNVWMGLAGFYILDDPNDPQTLPSGEFDVPLMVLDRSFSATNQLNYQFDANGVAGDHDLINGVPQPHFNVGDRKYRFRILNASNITDYEFRLDNGQSFLQVGTDAGLLPAPVSRTSILLGPAERADVIVDFSGKLGQDIVLQNGLESGGRLSLMQFRVNRDLTDDSSVPASLRPVENIGDPVTTRVFEFGRKGGVWTINGQPFDPNRIDARPVLGTTEKWVLRNTGGWSHIVHIHDVDQQLITRNGNPPESHELTKESWHIGGGQTVEVKLNFPDHAGRYMIHCHVLEHEDMAMMSQFEVVNNTASSNTGLRGPTAQQATTGGDNNGFELNPLNAFADAGGFASNIDGAGDRHVYSGYGINIPAGASIEGIEVRLDEWLDSTKGVNSTRVELSWDGGLTWSAAKTDSVESTREHSTTLGNTADTWGRPWSPSDFSDANFRVRVTSVSDNATRDFHLDWVPVRVHYRT